MHVQERISRFGLIPEIQQGDPVTFSDLGTLFFSKGLGSPSAWKTCSEDILPNQINEIIGRRGVSVMGFGPTPLDAYHDAYCKLKERLIKRGWQIMQLTNGLTLVNGANIQYHLAGVLVRVK